MKIVLASPYLYTMRGNTVTARRLASGLQAAGIEVVTLDYQAQQDIKQKKDIIKATDILHILNPVRYVDSPMYKAKWHEKYKYGITFTGTDLNEHLQDCAKTVTDLLANAQFVSVFHEQAKHDLLQIFPWLDNCLEVISQGYSIIENADLDEDNKHMNNKKKAIAVVNKWKKAGYKIILLPAGVRKVKRIPLAITMLNKYRQKTGAKVALLIVGSVIEQAELQVVDRLIVASNDIVRIGEMAHKTVLDLLTKVDIVLNSSASEGQALAIMEAFANKVPVLASNCKGNNAMVQHRENGFLYRDQNEFNQALDELLAVTTNIGLIIDSAYRDYQEQYSLQKEINSYVKLYYLKSKCKEYQDIEQTLRLLAEMYPDAHCELHHNNPFELLVATVLSAQCTDERVNIVTKELFKRYPEPQAYLQSSIEEVASYIRGLGLFRNKSKALYKMAKKIVADHDGQVPADRQALEKLPGVGRKTASVVLSNAFDIPALAVDTHVLRVSNRLGLASSSDVLRTEQQLMAIVPQEQWTATHHQLIFHGRRVCYARNPACVTCQLATYCQFYKSKLT